MITSFSKYQGTGNDFVIIDNREGQFPAQDFNFIARLCDRRFGIGADGLILVQEVAGFDFEMRYYNADGRLGSMCGNGARCAVAFAHTLNLFESKTHFLAVDGPHDAFFLGDRVRLLMQDVNDIEEVGNDFFLDTGSPHYVQFVEDLQQLDVATAGRAIRYNDRFREEGTNVNFLELKDQHLAIRTYERGVENETFSCGTGVVASAITAFRTGIAKDPERILLKAIGGDLSVSLESNGAHRFSNIWLEGPATFVFEGSIDR
ncbi:MAG: diaminopimelate epimerase [Salibacteraceae bacterium]